MSQPSQNPKKKTLDPEEQERILRGAYFHILSGFSSTEIDEKKAYIKHFDLQTQTIIDNYYHEVFSKARKKGLLTEEESVEEVLKNGSWTQEEEDQLRISRAGLVKLQEGIASAVSQAMADSMQGAVQETKDKIADLENKRASLITNTCEQIAERRSSDLIIRYSFYKENKKDPFFSEQEFDMLDRKDLAELVSLYNTAVTPLSAENIQSIAIADFFTSYYSVAQEDLGDFFRKPIHELTYFQVNLLNYAKLFSNILKNLDPPDHIKENAQKLLSFAKTEAKKRKSEARKESAKQKKHP